MKNTLNGKWIVLLNVPRASFALFATALLTTALLTTGCNPVGFNQMSVSESATAAGPFQPVNPPAPVSEGGRLSKGLCAADSSTTLLSCMTCVVPQAPPLPSQFSKKGQALYSILTAACRVPNGSDPAGYVPPTAEALMRRLNRLSPTLYPDSEMTPLQVSVVDQMLNNPDALRKYFGGIFYSGVNPETTAFETYFGIETREARWTFCYDGTSAAENLMFTRTNSTPIHSKQFLDCQMGGDPFRCQELPAYVAANTYRNQLRNAMTESLINPYKPGTPGPGKSCEWEKYEGDYNAEARDQIALWRQGGFTIGGDFHELRMCGELASDRTDLRGLVTLAAYRCR